MPEAATGMRAEPALRYPAATPSDVGRDAIGLAALCATIAALLATFALSPITLEAMGLRYFESGGGALSRLHPATPLAAVALLLRCLAARSPGGLLVRLLGGSGTALLLLATTVAAMFALLIDKTPVSPLADTFVLPILLAALLRRLDAAIARPLAVAVAALFALNALAAAAEILTHWRLIPIDVAASSSGDPTAANLVFSWQTELAGDWRARALFGHPIAGSAVTGAFVLCLVAPGSRWLPPLARGCLAALSGASLLTFGARTALVLTLPLAVVLAAATMGNAHGAGRRPTPRQLAVAGTCAGLMLVVALLLLYAGLADRTLARFAADDGSAATRLTMLRLLEPLSMGDLLLHPDRDQVTTLQRLYGLEFGIESSWLGLTLTYGLIVASMLLAGTVAFCGEISRRCGAGASIVLGFYLVLVSVTASMSGKTTTFAMVVALVLLFLRSGAPDASMPRADPV